MQTGDTIVAISSAIGNGALRIIVRISGPGAARFARDLFTEDLPQPGGASRRRLRFRVFPEIPCWIYCFESPRSVTGEDVIELHLPGNALLARMVLDELIRAGARQAEPGEFTSRAFFNGKIDLTEAEAVSAIVAAHSQAELDAARRLLDGELSRRLAPALENIASTLALIEAGIDFADEGISFLPADEFAKRIDEAITLLGRILIESSRFERLTHEPRVVLAGRPNAGKSTLLNALAGFERAIVSPVAGTTRDALHASVRLPRGFVRLIDAAGIETPDDSEIPRQMRAAAIRALQTADVVVLVHDSTDARSPLELSRPADLVVLNKCDLAHQSGTADALEVSALTAVGLDRLRARIDERCFGENLHPATANLALSARHVRAIQDAVASLQRAKIALPAGAEVAAFDLREALDFLGSILGHVTPDDILGRVFASFCIGK